MDESEEKLPARLAEIIDEFSEVELRERLELLLEFSDNLPPLSPERQAERDAGEHRVHECQTPVFLWVELTGGRLRIAADVAPEAPTVKGFVGLLVEAFDNAAPEEVLAAPPDLIQRLGIAEALGMVRSRGLHAILHRIRADVRRLVSG